MTTPSNDKIKWYVLTTSDRVDVIRDAFARISATRVREGKPPVEYFLPTIIVYRETSRGQAVKNKKLLERYVFVHAGISDIFEMKRQYPSMLLLPRKDRLDSGERKYLSVPDGEMEMFRRIAHCYSNEVPCYRPGDIDLEAGDLVRVIGGQWDGIEGTLVTQRGRDGGKVVLQLNGLFLVPTMEIEPRFIQIISFGKGNRHPYRKFEAHLPRAVKALTNLFDQGTLSPDDIAAMTTFTARFEALEPATLNVASSHAALMLMSYRALGDQQSCERYHAQCQRMADRITSSTQLGLHLAMMYAATGRQDLGQRLHLIVDEWQPIQPSQQKKRSVAEMLERFETIYTEKV